MPLSLTRTDSGPILPGDTVEFIWETTEPFPDYIGYQTTLSYDADLIKLTGIAFDPAFDTTALITPIPDIGDQSGETEVSFTAGVSAGVLSDGQSLATLTFEAVAPGGGSITLSEFIGTFFTGPNGAEVFSDPITSDYEIVD